VEGRSHSLSEEASPARNLEVTVTPTPAQGKKKCPGKKQWEGTTLFLNPPGVWVVTALTTLS